MATDLPGALAPWMTVTLDGLDLIAQSSVETDAPDGIPVAALISLKPMMSAGIIRLGNVGYLPGLMEWLVTPTGWTIPPKLAGKPHLDWPFSQEILNLTDADIAAYGATQYQVSIVAIHPDTGAEVAKLSGYLTCSPAVSTVSLLDALEAATPTPAEVTTLAVQSGIAPGSVLAYDGTRVVAYEGSLGGGAVTSVAGRAGDVTLTSADLADFTEAAQDAIAAMLVSGANVTLSYDDAANSLAVTASGGDAELMRDTIGAALAGVSGITVAVNDAADTITLSIANGAITASMLAAGVIPTWSTLSGKPAVIAAGADAAAARAAISAAASDAPGLLGRYVGVNAQTGTTYAPVLTDEGNLVTLTNAAAITLTLPSGATTAFPIGASFDVVASGAGMVTVVAGSGATVNGTPSLVTRAQWSTITAIKIAANTWLVVGDLA